MTSYNSHDSKKNLKINLETLQSRFLKNSSNRFNGKDPQHESRLNGNYPRWVVAFHKSATTSGNLVSA
jgi:hypothetical protein